MCEPTAAWSITPQPPLPPQNAARCCCCQHLQTPLTLPSAVPGTSCHTDPSSYSYTSPITGFCTSGVGWVLSARQDDFTKPSPVLINHNIVASFKPPKCSYVSPWPATGSLKQGAGQKQIQVPAGTRHWEEEIGNKRLILTQALHVDFQNATPKEEIYGVPNTLKIF